MSSDLGEHASQTAFKKVLGKLELVVLRVCQCVLVKDTLLGVQDCLEMLDERPIRIYFYLVHVNDVLLKGRPDIGK